MKKAAVMKGSVRVVLLAGAAVLLAMAQTGNVAQAVGQNRALRANLTGYSEVPAVSSTGSGVFRAQVVDGMFLEYELRFQDLEGDVTQAHIHFGQMNVNGGISIWLCGTVANPGPPGTPNCGGPRSGIVGRTVSADDVIGPAGQGIAAGEFQEVLAAIGAGAAYANVHSTRNAGGEIRGQIRRGASD